jgi:osmotically-inducible protein OsmY
MNAHASRPARSALIAALAACTLLAGCAAPLVIGGAALGSALVAIDRRTSGAQLEDQAIEFKAATAVRESGIAGNVNATSYNRTVLLTGEVPDEAARGAIEQRVARIDNVRSVVNELAVMGNSALTARSNDAIVSAKVKAAFVDSRDVQAGAIKVVTERGVVHLMGIVSEREATRAAEVARSVGGVLKVVRVFEVISEEELARLLPKPAPAR